MNQLPTSDTDGPSLHEAARTVVVFVATLLATSSLAHADAFEGARSDVDRRLSQALVELSEVRAEIAKEKVPLSKAVLRLEDQVLALRRKHEAQVKVKDSRTVDLTALRAQLESLASQEEFVDSRLNEFIRDFAARIDISELPRYESAITTAQLAGKNVRLDAEGRRNSQLAVVDVALGRLEKQLGGEVFAGAALSPEGRLIQGHFVALGPTVFFASEDGRVAGLVENQLNAADPVVVALPGELGAGIAELAAGRTGQLAFDPTLGKALKKERARKTLLQHIDDGGAVGYVILALGLAALLLTAFKSFEILSFPVGSPAEVDGILGQLARGDAATAARDASNIAGVAGEMLVTGVEHVDQKRGVLEELLFEKILKVRPMLERFLPFLSITAATAPLLGLLGTVIGMIKTFQLITIFGTGDAKSLSSGISEALVTTALGLCVAIPILILHGALSRMTRHKLGMLEQLSVAFVNGVTAIRPKGQH